jgi:small subunit ribosomal protein S16
VVVADQRSKRDGRVIETVGHYNAQTNPSTIVLDEERIRGWLARGAQPSDTVRKLLRIQGISPGGSASASAGGSDATSNDDADSSDDSADSSEATAAPASSDAPTASR